MTAAATLQRIDPLTGAVIRPVTLVLCGGIAGYTVIRMAFTAWQQPRPAFAIAAALTVVAACVVLTVRSRPLRTPIGRPTHALVLALGVIAVSLGAVADWGHNAVFRDDWGPVALGLLIIAISPYRPPLELVAGTLTSSVIIGVVAAAQVAATGSITPAGVLVVITVTPLLALGLGSAAYVGSATEAVRRWRSRSGPPPTRLDDATSAARRERVRLLADEVVPFYEQLLARGELHTDDRDRADRLSRSIRDAMIAEVGRTWLDTMLAETGRGAVHDPQRLAEAMTGDQRAALRAALLVLLDRPLARPDTLRAEVTSTGDSASLQLRCELDPADTTLRAELAPFSAVLRFVFSDLDIALGPTELTLRLHYVRT